METIIYYFNDADLHSGVVLFEQTTVAKKRPENSGNDQLPVRVVQYCDIMRFMIPCDRHHKVSPDPNP